MLRSHSGSQNQNTAISIGIQQIQWATITTIAVLLAANLAAIFVQHILDHPEVWGLVPLFHFDREQNLPSFFSALLLLISSGLLLIAAQKAKTAREKMLPWAFLSAVFLFLSIDEIASIHEKLDALIDHYTPTSGLFHYAWVAPYGAAVLGLAAVLARWFFNLAIKTRTLFFLAGVCFVGGALGVEIISGFYYAGIETNGADVKTFFGDLLATLEELAEMIGVAIFIYALLLHLCGERFEIRLKFA